MRRSFTALLVALMVVFGLGVYSYLGTQRTRAAVAAPAKVPVKTKPRFVLPGTLVLAQGGALYRLRKGVFTEIASGYWTQPVVSPDQQRLVAVRRLGNASELFLLDLDGHVLRQLTHDASRVVPWNHWSFYPRFSPDGRTLFYSYDPKDPGNFYRVDFAVYALPINARQSQARRWTDPYHYTGGDVQAVPLPSGGLLYTKFNIDGGQNTAQLWLQRGPFTISIGHPLTAPEEGCQAPALSPDGKRVAMICTGGKQMARLEVAPFDGNVLGVRQVLVDGLLAAAPAWAPAGDGLVFLAPDGPAGHFQLFYQSLVPPTASPAPPLVLSSPLAPGATHSPAPVPAPTPVRPIAVSTDLDLDPTAPPAWY